MALYYSLAAYQENRTFFIATVPMRLLTAIVFLGVPRAFGRQRRFGGVRGNIDVDGADYDKREKGDEEVGERIIINRNQK